MKAAIFERPGLDNLKLKDLPEPKPAAGEVLVRLRAASLNYRDTLVAVGGYGSRQKQRDLIPLSDGAGVIAAIGPDVADWKPGDRVVGCMLPGWPSGAISEAKLARSLGGSVDGCAVEYRIFPSDGVLRTPAHLSDIEAATLPCAALTAWNALVSQGRLAPGETVLTQGSGGVSLFALQFARLCGATVIATSARADRLARLGESGARHLINYRDEPEWARRVRALTAGIGVDHVVEVGGAGTLGQSIRAVRTGGTISMIGVLSKDKPDYNLALIVMQNIRLQGVTVGSTEQFRAMLDAIAAHKLRPVVDRVFPLAELGRAIEHLGAARHMGKVCIAI